MTSPIGVNVLSSQDLEAYTAAVHPAAVLIMNDVGGAIGYKQRHPECIVISRIYDGHEDAMYRTPGATLAYLQQRAAELGGADVFVNLACESGMGGTDDVKLLVSEQIKAMTWALAHGVKVAGPHGAFYGHTSEADFLALDPLGNLIADHPGQLLLTVDEYAVGHMFSGVVDPRVSGGNEAGHIQPETWKASPIPKYWHVGSTTVGYTLHRRARGLKLPDIVITEWGLDALSDVEAWRTSLMKTQGYDTIRGWRSLQAQHAAWYGNRGWSAERAYGEMLAACWREIYAPFPNIKAALIYCLGNNNDPQWRQFDIAGAHELWAIVAQSKSKGSPMPTPIAAQPKPSAAVALYTGKLKPKASTVNVRSAPDTSADVVAVLSADIPVTLFGGGEVNADGYDWAWVEWGAQGKGAWMAKLWLTWAQQIVVAVPTPTVVRHVDLRTPFVSQNGWKQNNLCFEACIAALAPPRTPLDIAALIPDRPAGAETTFAQGIAAAAKVGITLTKVTPTLAQMTGELDNGHPFIADVIRKRIPGWQQIYAQDADGSHLIVIDEYTLYDDGSVVFGANDPLGFAGRIGDGLPIQSADLLAGMKATGFATTALFVSPVADVPPPVETDEPRLWTRAELQQAFTDFLASARTR